MMAHEKLSDMNYEEVVRLFGFARDFKEQSQRFEGAGRVVEGKLTTLDPASAEYALAVTTLVAEGDDSLHESARENFALLLRVLSEIRPPKAGRGPMRKKDVPEKFGGMWPHERLGHKSWTSFVTSPPRGELDKGTRQFVRPPGLGWSSQYETNQFKGRKFIVELVDQARPEASEEEKKQAIDAAVAGAGVKGTKVLGCLNKHRVKLDGQGQAALALDAVTSGSVTAEDISERGSEALTNPRPKGKRRGKVEKAFALVDSMTPSERLDFDRQIRPLIEAAEREVSGSQ